MKRKSKSIFLFISILVLGVLLAACSSDEKASNTGDGGSANEGEAKKELVVDISSDPSTLDPGLQYNTASYTVYRNIFDNLLRRDPESLEIIPWVAESWEQTSETTWEFMIKEGIKFQDGSDLTTEDVVFSIERILDPDFGSAQFANFSMIEKVETDGNKLILTTAEPSPTLLTQLVNLSIVPKSYVEEVGAEEFNLTPMGSGPYKFEKWDKGSQVVLTKNEDYWNGDPEIEQVVFRAVTNAASRLADLQSGQADVIFPVSPDDIATIEQNESLKILSTPTERVSYLAFNTLGDNPAKDEKVRQAIAYGINYDELITTLLGGYGDKVSQVLTPFALGYSENIDGYDYDPEKAKQLLAEAGYEDGVTVDFATSPAYDQVIVEAIQGSLSTIGIDINIVSTDQATYLQKVQNGKSDWGGIRLGNWSCACLDADGTIYPLFRTGTVWSSYTNQEFDAVVDAARTSTNEEERLKFYEEALTILNEDVPGIGLWQLHQIYGVSKDLEWKPDAQESFFVFDMSWAD